MYLGTLCPSVILDLVNIITLNPKEVGAPLTGVGANKILWPPNGVILYLANSSDLVDRTDIHLRAIFMVVGTLVFVAHCYVSIAICETRNNFGIDVKYTAQ